MTTLKLGGNMKTIDMDKSADGLRNDFNCAVDALVNTALDVPEQEMLEFLVENTNFPIKKLEKALVFTITNPLTDEDLIINELRRILL